MGGKLKRKDFGDSYDEFADFPFFSPATKMRRLDAEVINGDSAIPLGFDNSAMLAEPVILSESEVLAVGSELAYNGNEERALVVYKPMENPLLFSPDDPTVPFRISSDLIHGLKNNFFRQADSSFAEMDVKMSKSNNCLAVVPWVPSEATIQHSGLNGLESQMELVQEPMEEETEAASMEVEEFT